VRTLRQIALKFFSDQGQTLAVVIAWNAVFSMFPILLIAVAVLGQLVGGDETAKAVRLFLAHVPDRQLRGQIVLELRGVHRASLWFWAAGFVGLAMAGNGLFGAVQNAFTTVYGTRPRGFWAQKRMSLGLIVLFAFFGGVAVLSSTLIPARAPIPGLPAPVRGHLILLTQLGTGLLSALFLFLCIYGLLPNRPHRLSEAMPGAVLAAVLFEIESLLFPLYISVSSGTGQYTSAFALFFVVLTFFYLLGNITVLGAEINSVLSPSEAAIQPGIERAA
jgi:membrane protein